MEFTLGAEQRDLQRTIRRFVDGVVREHAAVMERDDRVPAPVLDAARAIGLYGISVPAEYGGLGLSTVERALVHEQLGRGPFGLASYFSVHTGIGIMTLIKSGTPAQQQRYLPRMATGEVIGSFALTEPDAGSDAGALSTRAVRDGDHWVLNGRKQFITNAPVADLFTVFARTSDKPGSRGVSSFLVEKSAPGLKIGQVYDTTGHRGSQIGEVIFDDCRIPADAIVGEVDAGFRNALLSLAVGRTMVGSRCVGAAQRAIELALDYARTRRTFGKRLIDHQALAFWLAEMSARTDAARLLCYRSAWRIDQGLEAVRASSAAKLIAAETLDWVVDKAVQIHGGIAYVRGETEIERIWRDARVTRVYDGSSEIQKVIIAGQLDEGRLEHSEGM